MKLQTDLVRELLLHVEANATKPISQLSEIILDGWTPEEVAYHVLLLSDAHLIEASIEEIPDRDDGDVTHVAYTVHRLTMKGSEFLDTVREPEQWRRVKDGAKQAGVFTLGAIVRFGEAYVAHKVNQFLGGPS